MLHAPFQPDAAAPVMYWRRAFPGRPDQARAVREFVASLLPDAARLDEVLLVVAELVANSLRHTKSGQGGFFAVDVLHAADRTVVSVTDEGGPAEPVAADAAELAESGRGLRTVSLVADSWGWHGNDRGRTVTAVFTAEVPQTVAGAHVVSPTWQVRSRCAGRAGDESARAMDPAARVENRGRRM